MPRSKQQIIIIQNTRIHTLIIAIFYRLASIDVTPCHFTKVYLSTRIRTLFILLTAFYLYKGYFSLTWEISYKEKNTNLFILGQNLLYFTSISLRIFLLFPIITSYNLSPFTSCLILLNIQFSWQKILSLQPFQLTNYLFNVILPSFTAWKPR